MRYTAGGRRAKDLNGRGKKPNRRALCGGDSFRCVRTKEILFCPQKTAGDVYKMYSVYIMLYYIIIYGNRRQRNTSVRVPVLS